MRLSVSVCYDLIGQPGEGIEAAEGVRTAVSIPGMDVSMTRTPEQAEAMLRDGLVDLVAVGQPWLADPQ